MPPAIILCMPSEMGEGSMYCPKCGFQLADNAKFCPKCGSKVEQAQSNSQTQAAPVQQASSQSQYAQPQYDQPQYYAQEAQPQYTQPAQSQAISSAGQPVQAYAPAQQAGMVIPQRDNWSTITIVLLNVVTCGIYGMWFTSKLASEANDICQDGQKSAGAAAYILLGLLTFGIYCYYWQYKIQDRMKANAPHYGVTIEQGGGAVLGWSLGVLALQLLIVFLTGGTLGFLGTLLSYIPLNILVTSIDKLATAYNISNGVSYAG